MGLFKKTPTVLKSKEPVEEIVSASQARLAARKRENEDREKYLFGTGMKLLPRYPKLLISKNIVDTPRFVYK